MRRGGSRQRDENILPVIAMTAVVIPEDVLVARRIRRAENAVEVLCYRAKCARGDEASLLFDRVIAAKRELERLRRGDERRCG